MVDSSSTKVVQVKIYIRNFIVRYGKFLFLLIFNSDLILLFIFKEILKLAQVLYFMQVQNLGKIHDVLMLHAFSKACF